MSRRLLVACDMDGVLVQFSDGIAQVHNRRHGTSYDGDWTLYRIEDQFPPDVARNMDQILAEPGFFAGLQPYPEAAESVQRLLALHDVEVCSMPPHRPPDPQGRRAIDAYAAADKVGWLVRWLPELAGDVTLTTKKWLLRADALVDDAAHNVARWAQEHPQGVGWLVARPWNEGVHLPPNARRGALLDAAEGIRQALARP